MSGIFGEETPSLEHPQLLFCNLPDIHQWVRTSDKVTKDGLLLVDYDSISQKSPREFLFSKKSESEMKGAITLKAKLKANLLALWDCDSPNDQDESTMGLIILERVMVELGEGTSQLPYPIRITFHNGSSYIILSAFSEDDREDWLTHLSQASRELIQTELTMLSRKLDGGGSVKRGSKSGGKGTGGGRGEVRRNSSLGDNEISYKGLCTNGIMKSFEFIGGSASSSSTGGLTEKIICEEWMFESKLSFVIPELLVKLYISWEQQLKLDLELAFPFLSAELEDRRGQHIAQINHNIRRYQRILDFLDSYSGPHFKKTTARDQQDLLFIPTNLHVQRFSVQESHESTKWKLYDFVTSGTYSAVALGFEDGGCSRIRQTILENLTEPELVDSSSEMRFYPRRKILKDLTSRVESLRNKVRRSEEWKFEKFKSVNAERLLIDMKEITTMLKDWTASFPLIPEAVDQLASLFAAEQEGTSAAEGAGSDPILSDDDKEDDQEVRESLDVLWTDAEALVTSFSTKVQTLLSLDEGITQNWLDNTRHAAEKALSSISALLTTLSDAQLFRLLVSLDPDNGGGGGGTDLINLHYSLQYRRDVILSMAVSTVTTALAKSLWLCGDKEDEEMEKAARETDMWANLGPVFTILSYLSCHGDEKGMLEDMVEAWHQIQSKINFKFISAFSSVRSACLPIIQGSRSDLTVSVPIPEKVFKHLSATLRNGASFKVYPVLWNVGVNYEMAISQMTGEYIFEKEINNDAIRDLGSYIEHMRLISEERRGLITQADIYRAQAILAVLREEVEQNTLKNLKIIRNGAQVSRIMHGLTLHTCKSGKDRTGMGITMEETDILRETCGLPEHRIDSTLKTLRSEGVRRENCAKNVGVPTYAFSSLSIQFLPPEFRPPPDTYGVMYKYLT